MASMSPGLAWRGVRRAAPSDIAMIGLAAAHAAVLVTMPTAPVIALGLWWNANTIAHCFIHRPFFRQRLANRLFAGYLSVLLGIPQALWRDRHLAHHAGTPHRFRFSGELTVHAALVVALWAAIAARAPMFFLSVYMPGYIAGLVLCALHGYYEHARGATSYYGKLYNMLFFNDGYHVEHHVRPGVHWSDLPGCRPLPAALRMSAWPAPLRWMEGFGLQLLEHLVLHSRLLQSFVLRTHACAFRALVAELPGIERVAIVGGGLFPRTALILRELLPAARITIIDASSSNLDRARRRLTSAASDRFARIDFVHGQYTPADGGAYDLVVIPLSFDGDRAAVYARPPAAGVLVHDWIWRTRGVSRIVAIALLKRINLVRR